MAAHWQLQSYTGYVLQSWIRGNADFPEDPNTTLGQIRCFLLFIYLFIFILLVGIYAQEIFTSTEPSITSFYTL